MTYFIRQSGDRWQICAGDVCVLSCEDHSTAARTVLAAMAMLLENDGAGKRPPLASRLRQARAPEATTIAARGG